MHARFGAHGYRGHATGLKHWRLRANVTMSARSYLRYLLVALGLLACLSSGANAMIASVTDRPGSYAPWDQSNGIYPLVWPVSSARGSQDQEHGGSFT
jgi:hypothetical protein